MLVDGKAIAATVLHSVADQVKNLTAVPKMSAVTCAPNFETKKYLEMKKQKATSVGIALNVIELSDQVTTKDVTQCVEKISAESDGVVVQLPMPSQIDIETVISAVAVRKDPDGFSYGQSTGACLPPVVGAIAEISKIHDIDWQDKTVLVLGDGRLVGRPVAEYARRQEASVTQLTKEVYDEELLKTADIIVSGIGQPNFIKLDLVKEGVIIFDAGTSEAGGVLVGDVDPQVFDKASLITPVPGGIGPITIACLLRNLVDLASRRISE